MNNLTFAVLTDGRNERIEKCYRSWVTNLDLSAFSNLLIFDASGVKKNSSYLSSLYGANVVSLGDTRLSLPEAFNKTFSHLSALGPGHTLFFEDDFEVPRKIDILSLLEIANLAELTQLALVRQPWYDYEISAGGLLKFLKPILNFEQKAHGELMWLEHRAFWTNNPSLINNSAFKTPYPLEFHQCEHKYFQGLLLENPSIKMGYYGSYEDLPSVIHRG